MKLQLKNLKIAGGEETLRFSAEIYLDRTKIATVANGGTGGCNEYGYYSTDSEQIFNDYIDRLKNEPFDRSSLFHRRLVQFLTDFQTNMPSFNQKDLDNDFVIDCQIQLQEDLKQCKKHTVFRIPSDAKNIQRTLNEPFSPEVEAWIVHKYGSSVVILNKLIES